LGDFAWPCFVLAKGQKKSPATVAQELAMADWSQSEVVEKVVAAGPYLNFFVKKDQGISKEIKSNN
jgi:arginyl-tRNA synthetase